MNHKVIISLLSLLLTLFSCSPKDEKLIRPDSVSKVKAENNSTDDLIKLSFIVFDKQAEAFYFLKALFNKDYAAQNKLLIETVSDTGTTAVKRISAAEARNESEKFLQTSEVELLAVVTRDESKNISQVIIRDNAAGKSNHNLFVKENGRSTESPTLLVINKSKRLTFTAASAGTFELETDSVDLLRTHSKKNSADMYTDLSAVTSRSTFLWDGKESNINDKIKLTALSFSHLKTSQVKSELALSSDGGVNLLIDLGPCVNWNGDIHFSAEKSKGSKSGRKFTFNLQDSSIQVSEPAQSFLAQDCATRPVVDMRKLL